MNVVTHFHVKTNLNAKKPGQLLLQAMQPLSAILVVVAGKRVHATEERSADASRPAMVHPYLPTAYDLISRTRNHRSPLSQRIDTLSEALRDEQARTNGVFASVDHPVAGTFETVTAPIRLSAHPMPGGRPAPALGGDGEAILAEAGLPAQEIEDALGAKATAE